LAADAATVLDGLSPSARDVLSRRAELRRAEPLLRVHGINRVVVEEIAARGQGLVRWPVSLRGRAAIPDALPLTARGTALARAIRSTRLRVEPDSR
jgi:hypothetical protein